MNSHSWNLYEVRVVLVEDDDDLRVVMAEYLTIGGHDVRQAANVPQALSLLSTFQPEVMLIDIVLPVFDGNYLAAAIRRRGQLRPRLIAVTGRQERAQPALFDAVLPKPAAGADVVRFLELATTGAPPDASATPSGDDDDR
jgi:DNA-binding response OmpR family regulator